MMKRMSSYWPSSPGLDNLQEAIVPQSGPYSSIAISCYKLAYAYGLWIFMAGKAKETQLMGSRMTCEPREFKNIVQS